MFIQQFQAFSKNGRNSIEPLDEGAQLVRNIGQGSQLSFTDVKTINLAYCTGNVALVQTI